MKAKILHIAPFNTAGVPLALVNAEQRLGYESRLVILGKPQQGRASDISLSLPFLDSPVTRFAKERVTPAERREIMHTVTPPAEIPVIWRPGTFAERVLIGMRDILWKKAVNAAITAHRFDTFDVFQLDGGLGFFRNSRFIAAMHRAGKTIICCYTGSDLRTRGVIPDIDRMSALNVTVEYDHLRFHPDIHYVAFPYEPPAGVVRSSAPAGAVRVGHAPTNRKAKGSDRIIAAVRELAAEYSVQLVLIENMPFTEALRLKSTCDIFIDQIGNLGFGINSLEALSMGIPVLTSLAPGYGRHYPDHPFVPITGEDIKERLIPLLTSRDARENLGRRGIDWVKKHHDPVAVAERIHRLAGV
ncbi:glycosyltransferase [bacterium]|nr:glycosyltransferase [bacterium]